MGRAFREETGGIRFGRRRGGRSANGGGREDPPFQLPWLELYNSCERDQNGSQPRDLSPGFAVYSWRILPCDCL